MPGPFGARARTRKRAFILLISSIVTILGAVATDPTDEIDPLTFDRIEEVQSNA